MATKPSLGRKQSPNSPAPPRRRAGALAGCVNVADVERVAQRRLKRAYFDYYAGGAEDERTLARNRAGFDRFVFLPRVLVDVSRIRTATTVLSIPVTMPILLSPTAYHRLADPEGEVATARAAGGAGVLMTVSTVATRTLEQVAAAATGPLWFQLYVNRDRAFTQRLVQRAERAGFRALVLTVDTPRLGRRERDLRTDFRLPKNVTLANLRADPGRKADWGGFGSFAAYANHQLDASLTWEDVAWLRGITSLPVILKGIMRADDARRAVDAGAAAVWVSNHGGRQLDSEQATILALPAVVEAVAGRVEVYVDGGFRRGTDVLKALALGARAVCIGRPYLWGLAAGGEKGVRLVLDLLRGELENSMAIAGATDVTAVDPTLVVPA